MQTKRIIIISVAAVLVVVAGYLFVSRATAPKASSTVTFTTVDGFTIAATYYPGSTKKGVILAPGFGQTRAVVAPFALVLQKKGFTVLAIDLRGHGDSSGDAKQLTPTDWLATPQDIVAARAYLLQQSPKMKIGAVGGGLGANAIVAEAVQYGGISVVGALSPNPNIQGLAVNDAFANYTGALYVMDQYIDPDDEKYHGRGIEPVIVEPAGDLFFAATTEDKQWFEVKEGGTGWVLMKPGSEVEKLMTQFLSDKLK